MEVVEGFKAFHSDYTNRHGMKFEEGKTYQATGEIKFGNSSTAGYHMCKRIEDTFRYFDAVDDKIQVAKVIGSGKIVEYEDDYNGYYDMYSVEKIKIIKFLERKEILEEVLKDPIDDRVNRLIQTFKLNEEEIQYFKGKFANNYSIMNNISYYQEDKKDTYVKKNR